MSISLPNVDHFKIVVPAYSAVIVGCPDFLTRAIHHESEDVLLLKFTVKQVLYLFQTVNSFLTHISRGSVATHLRSDGCLMIALLQSYGQVCGERILTVY